jgi:F420-non-reducing hydrogenase large subunit
MHWARVIENLYAAERVVELAEDKEVTSDKFRIIPTETPGEGIGAIEAPRGTLYHHYWADKDGMVEKVNLLVASGQNNASMCMDVGRAAEKFIHNFKVDQGLLNLVEIAFRSYDPCFACATHSLPGHMPLEVNIYDAQQNMIKTLRR